MSFGNQQEGIVIPQIDFLQKEKTIDASEIEKVKSTFQNFRIVEIINHGIEASLWNNLLKISKEFFALENSKKEEILMPADSNSFRGYTPIFQETTQDQKPNWYELIEFGVDLAEYDPRVLQNKPMFGKNLYPKNNEFFKTTFESYTSKLENIGMWVLDLLSLTLGLQQNFFANQIFDESHWQFRILHYPDRKNVTTEHIVEDEHNYSCDAHTDYGLVTLLQFDEPGLEIQLPDGTWKKLELKNNSLICLIGESIESWTNGFYKALVHRVYTNKERFSFPFFLQPNYDTIIKPFTVKESGQITYVGGNFQYGPHGYEKYKKIYRKT